MADSLDIFRVQLTSDPTVHTLGQDCTLELDSYSCQIPWWTSWNIINTHVRSRGEPPGISYTLMSDPVVNLLEYHTHSCQIL